MNLNPFELKESLELENKTEYDNEYEEYNFYGWDYTYKELIKSISVKVNWEIEGGFKDYQGEFFFLGKDDEDKFYFVESGYGSCSGCDALQACDTYEELIELRDRLKRKVRQFDNLNEFVEWFNDNGQYEYYNTDDVEDFIEKVKEKYEVVLIWRPDWMED